MRCEQIQPNLLEFSLQPSSCPEHEAIRAHLGECAECRQVLEQERKLASDLSGLGPVSPVTDMWPVIRDRVRARTPAWRSLSPWLVWSHARGMAAAAGVAVMLIAGATFVGITQHSAETRQTVAVSHLVEMQRQSQTTAWLDDPLKGPSDRAQVVLEEGS